MLCRIFSIFPFYVLFHNLLSGWFNGVSTFPSHVAISTRTQDVCISFPKRWVRTSSLLRAGKPDGPCINRELNGKCPSEYPTVKTKFHNTERSHKWIVGMACILLRRARRCWWRMEVDIQCLVHRQTREKLYLEKVILSTEGYLHTSKWQGFRGA